jgi:hypothetical protein
MSEIEGAPRSEYRECEHRCLKWAETPGADRPRWLERARTFRDGAQRIEESRIRLARSRNLLMRADRLLAERRVALGTAGAE